MSGAALQTAVPCADTAELADLAACDAGTLIEILDKLIGEGSDDAAVLAGARLLAARMGMVADAIALAHGGRSWRGADPAVWSFCSVQAQEQAYGRLLATGRTVPRRHQAQPQGEP